jgi:hypothetical protein
MDFDLRETDSSGTMPTAMISNTICPDPRDPGSIGTKDLLKIHKDKSGTLMVWLLGRGLKPAGPRD